MKEKLEKLLAELKEKKAKAINSMNEFRPISLENTKLYDMGERGAFSFCIDELEKILK